MNITEAEHLQYMFLLKNEIYQLCDRYRSINEAINQIDHPNRLNPYKGSLTRDELIQLREDTKERQHELFRQWHKLNNQRKEAGIDYSNGADVNQLIVGVTRALDALKATD